MEHEIKTVTTKTLNVTLTRDDICHLLMDKITKETGHSMGSNEYWEISNSLMLPDSVVVEFLLKTPATRLVHLSRYPVVDSLRKIPAIKALRNLTGFGIREAKAFLETADICGTSSADIVRGMYNHNEEDIKTLRDIGYEFWVS